MGLHKKLSSIEQQYELFNRALEIINGRLTSSSTLLDAISAKLDQQKVKSIYSRLVAVRNWLSFVLLCFILALLLSSCFVSGRTLHFTTPRINIEADTATAFSLPYDSKGNWK